MRTKGRLFIGRYFSRGEEEKSGVLVDGQPEIVFKCGNLRR